jgi:ribosome-associated protein
MTPRPGDVPDDDVSDEGTPLRSRSDARRELQRGEEVLMELSEWLVKQGDRVLLRLELAEDAVFAIKEAKRIQNPGARKRALRLVRTALRDTDVVVLKQKIEDLAEGKRDAASEAASEWSARLAAGADDVIDAFVAAHPAADRQRVRQLVRNVKKAAEGKAAEAQKTLSKALAAYVRATKSSAPE